MNYSKWRKFLQILYILFTVIVASSIGIFYPTILIWMIALSAVAMIILLWQFKKTGYKPQTKTYKTVEKIKKKREKTAYHKHQHIYDQIAYIDTYWGYTKEQERITRRFVEKRAYSEMYNKLTASLFPQVIALIDQCNEKEQKGCKREVSRRIRELTNLMKTEIKKHRGKKEDDFDTTLKAYDHLIKEIKT